MMEATMSPATFPKNIFIAFVISLLTLGIGFYIFSQPDTVSKQLVVSQYAELTAAQIETVNKHGNHAYVRHGVESVLALKCLQEFGSFQSFDTFPDDNPDFNSITFLCKKPNQPDTNYVVVLKKMADGTWELITAYKVSKEIFPSIANYIGYLVEYWNATSSKVAIKAGEIIYNFSLR